MAKNGGFSALITSDTCMYLSSFESLRKKIINENTLLSLIDTRGTNAHPDVFDANAGWILRHGHSEGYRGHYFKLNHKIEEKGEALLEAIQNPDCGWFYRADASTFHDIPGSPIAYWASEAVINTFKSGTPLIEKTPTHLGMATCDNNRFLRLWWEPQALAVGTPIEFEYGCNKRWAPYNKGGIFRKWSGNDKYVVDWKDSGDYINSCGAVMVKDSLRFTEMISWTRVSSAVLAVRYKAAGYLFDMTGPGAFGSHDDLIYRLAFLNSAVAMHVASFMSATIDFQPGQIGRYPIIEDDGSSDAISSLAGSCIELSKVDWDSRETSWDFKRNPLV